MNRLLRIHKPAGTIDLERQMRALYNLSLFAIGGECSSKAEHLAVAQVVVGSIPITHPIFYLPHSIKPILMFLVLIALMF